MAWVVDDGWRLPRRWPILPTAKKLLHLAHSPPGKAKAGGVVWWWNTTIEGLGRLALLGIGGGGRCRGSARHSAISAGSATQGGRCSGCRLCLRLLLLIGAIEVVGCVAPANRAGAIRLLGENIILLTAFI